MSLSLQIVRSDVRRSFAANFPSVYRATLRSKKKLCRSSLLVAYRMRSNDRRLKPSFFIAGTRKGGTTFLFRLLASHPQVAEPILKELNLFGPPCGQDVSVYESYFPIARARDGERIITGESTPHYMFYPHWAAKAALRYPEARVLVVLRDPAARAYSEWRMNTNRGREEMSFEEALSCEEERIEDDWRRSLEDPGYWSENLSEHAYKKRGLYLEQIERLERSFPRERILVLKSSEMWRITAKALLRAEVFLGLAPWVPERIVPENVGINRTKPSRATMESLRDYFKPHDQALFEHLGWEAGW